MTIPTGSPARWVKLILSGLRMYTRYAPIQRGKGRVQRLMLPLIHRLGSINVDTRYATRFQLQFPEDTGWECLYTMGTYETGTADLIRAIIRPDDVVFDVGANLGWYTCLFARLLGANGAVHAFEPVPWIFRKLEVNCALNPHRARLSLNNLAVGDHKGSIDLHTFADQPHGQTSTRIPPNTTVQSSVTVPMTTLQQYSAAANSRRVDLIKVDVEGTELQVLDGAVKLLQNTTPPLWLFEFNVETATLAGWSPYDLLDRLRQHGYRFLRIEGAWGKTRTVQLPSECQHGDNVLCYVPDVHRSRLEALPGVA